MSKKSKIIVTGGAGFIGSHTVVELDHAGYIPIIIDDFSNSNRIAIDGIQSILNKSVILYEGDCNDEKFLQDIFKKENDVQGVIHFAAFKAVGESLQEPLKYYQNNLGSLMTILKVMREYEIMDFVFSSSATVYGQPETLPVTEKSPKQTAESPYGNVKQIGEEIIEDVVKSQIKLKAIALRYFNPVGAHPSGLIGEFPLGIPNNLIPFITQTAAGIREKLTIYGDDYDTSDGTCIRDYIHVVDLAKAHVKALFYLENQKTNNSFDIFNIGTGRGNSVMEIIDTFEKVNNTKLNYIIGERREGDVQTVYADVSLANEILNWKAELSLEESLKDAWHWQEKLGKQSK